MNAFFTSDPHLGHTNIIKYCNRPFISKEEMDETIIANWNRRATNDDIVYCAGDFAFGRTWEEIEYYVKRLKGKIILIKGNHDKLKLIEKCSFHDISPVSMREIRVNEQEITISHYAMRVWNKSHYGAWNLYGHSHGNLLEDLNSLSFDIGMDANNFKLLDFEEIKLRMSKKTFVPIDHHRRD